MLRTVMCAFAGWLLSSYAASAEINCSVDTTWTIVHANGAVVHMQMRRDPSGSFILKGKGDAGVIQDNHEVLGTVEDGKISGRELLFTISWTNGHKGRYSGAIATTTVDGTSTLGRAHGDNYDLTNPSAQTTWYTEESFFCR